MTSEHIYKSVEVTGSSEISLEDAINRAVERTAQSVHNLRWFEVTDIRGHLTDQRLAHWQVTVKISFTLDE